LEHFRNELAKLISLAALLLSGDFYTGGVLASSLTKLLLRFAESSSDGKLLNSLRAEVRVLLRATSSYQTFMQAMLIMTSIIRVGQSKFVSVTIDEDSADRILQCIQTLSELEENKVVKEIFMVDTKTAYAQMLHNEEVRVVRSCANLFPYLT
jgi:coatomer subunit beta